MSENTAETVVTEQPETAEVREDVATPEARDVADATEPVEADDTVESADQTDADQTDAEQADAEPADAGSADPVDAPEGEDAAAPAKSGKGGAESGLLAEGDLVADYLEELLDIADLDGDIENSVVGGRAHIVIDTDDERLVGRDGQVLEALQELARLVVMTETGHRSRLTLDVAGYREKRRIELVALAKDAIAEVQETGEQVRMAPLNAYERKIVHDEIAAAGLNSESEGEPPSRRVVVTK